MARTVALITSTNNHEGYSLLTLLLGTVHHISWQPRIGLRQGIALKIAAYRETLEPEARAA